jgi:hypothetical protein
MSEYSAEEKRFGVPQMDAEIEAQSRRIAALQARVAAADKLAELLNLPDQSDGLAGQYHYDWHKVDEALAAYQATKEQIDG